MKTAIVVGSGAGGATVARELQGDYQVTVLERGGRFQPFSGNLRTMERLRRRAGLLLNRKQIEWLVPGMRTETTEDGMVLVKGICEGGTTTISTGNAVRQDRDLQSIGIDLEAEFATLERDIPICSDHQDGWHEPTREAFDVCRSLGLNPRPTPKMMYRERCVGCGRCVLGCPAGAKWDSRVYLREAVDRGTEVVLGCEVREVAVEDGRAVGVLASNGRRSRLHRADLIVLAAGGLGTPAILQQSRLQCLTRLFVDPVLCVATRRENALQDREIPMPFLVQSEHFMMSPYFDYLSYFFDSRWNLPAGDIFSLMIKLADVNAGTVSPGGVRKPLQDVDRVRLDEGVGFCRDILHRMGAADADIFLGSLNAGHPGGMLPLTESESTTLHHECLPDNVYVADASLFPGSLGNPPSLTIMALAMRVARLCRERLV